MTQSTLDVRVHPDRERVVVELVGDLDHFTAPKLRAAVRELYASGWRDVTIDLRGVEFMGAGGVHVLEEIRDGLHGPARFSMLDGHEPVSMVLRMAGEPHILPPADPR